MARADLFATNTTAYELILRELQNLGLSRLQARPYDCSYSLLAAPASRKRLVVVGLNGSSADEKYTNEAAVKRDYTNPDSANIDEDWGQTPLPKRLKEIGDQFGGGWEHTVYTNAVLLCSPDAAALPAKARNTPLQNLEIVIRQSLAFFANVTMRLSEPDLIVTYSNGLTGISAARVLLQEFGLENSVRHVDRTRYYATFSFTATINGRRFPVVCIRHLSRHKCDAKLIQAAWDAQIGSNSHDHSIR